MNDNARTAVVLLAFPQSLALVLVGACGPTPRPASPASQAPRETVSPALQRTGQHQLGPIYFDPQGADFTAWVRQFKDQVYRNWKIPDSVVRGASGEVEIEFTVERAGTLSRVGVRKSSTATDLDKAAETSMRASRFLSLPSDFPNPQVTMRISFFYNVASRK